MVTARSSWVSATARIAPVLLLLINAVQGVAAGQSGDANRRTQIRAWFADTYRTDAVSDGALDTLVRLWVAATDSTTARDDRQDALRGLVDAMIGLRAGAEDRYAEQARAAMAARADEIRGLAAPPDPLPIETARPGELGKVEVRGNGPVPLVLLSDIDYDGALYDEFVAQHLDRFTMYVVTLPGAGGTRPPPYPVGSPPSETAWWGAAARGVLSLVEERGIDRPVIVGTLNSVYLAARLAIDHPDRFRAAILLHGLVSGYLNIPGVGASPTPEQRRAWIDATLPDLFPRPSPDSVTRSYLAAAAAAAIDSGTARTLALRAARTHPDVVSRYGLEIRTTDLHDDFARLEIPTLVIPSIHDERSPTAATEFGSAQWLSLQLEHPDAPLTVVPFRATRNYAAVDSPDELGDAIGDFLAGRAVRGKPADPALSAFRLSPRASVFQVLGATDVEIAYSSPAARDRTIWGGVVAYDRLWPAGTAVPTRITFSRAVEVNGQPLEAGAYSIFMIPREREPWTVVLNRVDVQYGLFTYDAAHDALRLDLSPTDVEYEERLRYRIQSLGPVEGRVEMTWAGKDVGFDVVAVDGTGFVRIAALDPERFRTLPWTRLAIDTAGDGRTGAAPDARALSFYHDAEGDTLWFRFDLHNAPSPHGVGMNIAVDTDRDQTTGSRWWGGNGDFRYDRVATAWVMKGRDDAFWGTVGLSDHASAGVGRYAALGAANLAVAVDVEGQALVLGVRASSLDDDGRMRLIGTVGTNMFWNDEAVDRSSVEVVLQMR